MNKTCFHCGLDVLQKSPPTIEIEGEPQNFCCHGCYAVCKTIINSGNGDYYRYREGKSRNHQQQLPALMDKLKLYDNETIQREFIRSDKENNWKEASLILEEIRCAACMWLNEQTLRQLDGVLDVQMDYTGQQARIRWNPDKIKLSDILRAITNIGYIAHPFDPSQREALNKEQKQRSIQRIIFALILGMSVMQTAVGGYFFNQQDADGNLPLWLQISRWVSVVSTFLILAYPGQLFYRNAWRDLKNKSLGMDVPIVMGLSVAWLGSLYSTMKGTDEVYFESIAMFVIFLLIARYIELRSRITATTLLDRSAKIIPQTATLLADEDKPIETPVIELKKGDIIQVSAGETVAVDGLLLSSNSSFDESLLTGESLPVSHHKGDKILGGSINVEQRITLKVLSAKADSTLNEIHQLTQKSIHYRPYYVDIAEQVAAKFVAIILLIAITTFAYWSWQGSSDALSNMVAVLIVTCPCALALAAPVALSLGAASLNKLHVLPVQMSSIEKLSAVGTLVFDKTGTLTTGSPTVEKVIVVANQTEQDYLSISAHMEQGSQHPFAKAIIAAAPHPKEATPIKDLKYYTGQGVEAVIEKEAWRLGNEVFTQTEVETLPSLLKTQVLAWRKSGKSILYLAKNTQLQAIFCISDPLREGIEDFLHQAKQLGINRVVILSGDHQQSVTAIAKQLNINEAHGGLSPQDKLDWMKQQTASQAEGTKTIMLGDGINDAPTLAAADISMTFADATDLAKNNGDFILLGKGYTQLASAFRLMRKTRAIILQNLGWAVAYNVLAVPAAAMGMISPWMAAIGMSLSSLLVVLNSMRLKSENLKLEVSNNET
ncbi:MAG TPA: heavy metal translocating P-type ATPase [Leucothrix mucor]|nr:heavy metal translocating P-type ATPase [Leucothrix mucor]